MFNQKHWFIYILMIHCVNIYAYQIPYNCANFMLESHFGGFFIVFYRLKIIASPWAAAISRIPSPLCYKEEDF